MSSASKTGKKKRRGPECSTLDYPANNNAVFVVHMCTAEIPVLSSTLFFLVPSLSSAVFPQETVVRGSGAGAVVPEGPCR